MARGRTSWANGATFAQRAPYRTLVSVPRFRLWPGTPTASAAPTAPKVLVAELSDGPLSGSKREITAVEGRPPKTIEIEFGDRTARYCLAEWNQSGHSAVYGFLYEV